MPIFDHSTGFHILGGNFYEVAGDVHFQNADELLPRQLQDHRIDPSYLKARLFGASTGRHVVQPAGVRWSTRLAIDKRVMPYDISPGPTSLWQNGLTHGGASLPLSSSCSSNSLDLLDLSACLRTSTSINLERKQSTPNDDATFHCESPSGLGTLGESVMNRARPHRNDSVSTITGGTFISTTYKGFEDHGKRDACISNI
ncbi:hypothetical protein FB451DRAFT_1274018 [Mycena latifolia]|nr:hypothetical protein FB451DRAFT_1274018 [Mycena latifolia]